MSVRRVLAGLGASAAVVAVIAGYEGYTDKAVVPVPGDVPTIGFGTTEGVKMGDRIDPVRAVQKLAEDADETAAGVDRCVGDVPMYPHERAAYLSLAYNIGVGAFCGSTLAMKLRRQPPDYQGACREILRWNKVGGREVRGLTVRREAEYRQCVGS